MFERFAAATSKLAGHSATFILACFAVLIWAATGPIFGYSEAWQLVINTGTTVVTFLMVFLVQATQNRDTIALHAKLDEIIRSHSEAANMMIGIERLPSEQVEGLRKQVEEAAK